MCRHIFDCVIFAPWFKVCVCIEVSSSETLYFFFARVVAPCQIYQVTCIQYGVTKEWLCHLSVGCLGNFGMRHRARVGCYTSSCYERHGLLTDAWCVCGSDFSLGTHLWKCFAGISWNELLGHGAAGLAKVCLCWALRGGAGWCPGCDCWRAGSLLTSVS